MPEPNFPAQGPADQYGSITGFWGGVHDWYLIVLALVVLYLVMRYFPTWGLPLGFVILLGAILFTPEAVTGFKRLVSIVQTGTMGGKTSA
jgi:hypothetical protein